MTRELDKEQIKKDIEMWGKHLRMIDILIHQIYDEMNQIYKEVTQ